MFKIKIAYILILLVIICIFLYCNKKETFSNDKKIVLITGTTSGIGKKIIKAFDPKKFKIIIHGRKCNKLNNILKRYSKTYDIEKICYDLSNKNNIYKLINEIIVRFSKIDLLINNFYDSSNISNIWYQINTNLNNYILLTSKISYIMNPNSKIINISSGLADSTNSNGTFIDTYSIIKVAIEKFTKIYASKLYLDNIGVICLKIDDSYKTPLTIKFLDNTQLKDPNQLVNVFKNLIEIDWKEITGKIINSSSLIEDSKLKYLDTDLTLEKDSIYKLLEDSNKKNKIVGNNINPQSTKINEIIRNNNWDFSKYASETGKLESVLINKHKVKSENILFHNGTINFLDKVIGLFVKQYHEIITSEDCWGILNSIGLNQNKYIIRIENLYSKFIEINFSRIAYSVNTNTRMIYLVAPIFKSQFDLFLDKIPKNLIIIIDFCYNDFFPNDKRFIDMGDYLDKNIIAVNTFSKFYSIPGINLSYSICNKNLNEILKQYFYYPISKLIENIAIAAINDNERNNRNINYFNDERIRIAKIFDKFKIKYHFSYQNSVFVKTKLKEEEIKSYFKKINLNKEIIMINGYYTFAIVDKLTNDKIISIITK